MCRFSRRSPFLSAVRASTWRSSEKCLVDEMSKAFGQPLASGLICRSTCRCSSACETFKNAPLSYFASKEAAAATTLCPLPRDPHMTLRAHVFLLFFIYFPPALSPPFFAQRHGGDPPQLQGGLLDAFPAQQGGADKGNGARGHGPAMDTKQPLLNREGPRRNRRQDQFFFNIFEGTDARETR